MTMPDSELVVVKLGGETFASGDEALHGVVDAAAGHRLVLVHGGGKRLTGWLDRLGIESRFEDGLRVTEGAVLDVAVAVLGGLVNSELVAAMSRLGLPVVGLTGADGGLIVAERLARLGHVGRVVGARPAVVHALIERGLIERRDDRFRQLRVIRLRDEEKGVVVVADDHRPAIIDCRIDPF